MQHITQPACHPPTPWAGDPSAISTAEEQIMHSLAGFHARQWHDACVGMVLLITGPGEHHRQLGHVWPGRRQALPRHAERVLQQRW